MNEYNLKDICLYAACPLKHLYLKQGKDQVVAGADDRLIIATAVRDTYIKYFQMKGLGKPLSVSRAAEIFSRLAFDYKRRWSQSSSKFFEDTQLLVNAHSLIVNIENFILPSDELIAAEFPLQRTMGTYSVVDTSDVIIFRHPPGKESYIDVIYFDTNAELSKPDFNILLRANFGMSVVIRELAGEALTVQSTLYNVLTGNTSKIELLREQRFNYQGLIKNIIRGIENKVYYPRPSYGACEHCTYSDICSWKINDKDKTTTVN